MSKGWPEPWEQMLRDLHQQGLSGKQIASRLNGAFSTDLSRQAVIAKTHRLGLARDTLKGEPSQTRQQGGRLKRLKSTTPSSQRKPGHNALTFRSAPVPHRPRIAPAGPPAPLNAPIGIMALTAKCCRWPIDPAPPEGWRYCGCAVGPSDPKRRYCDHHRWRELYGQPQASMAPVAAPGSQHGAA